MYGGCVVVTQQGQLLRRPFHHIVLLLLLLICSVCGRSDTRSPGVAGEGSENGSDALRGGNDTAEAIKDIELLFRLPVVGPTKGLLSPLPLPISGKCPNGRYYIIKTPKKLNEYADELDCIWSVGLTPDTVPVGHIPGTAIAIANTGFYNKLAAKVYRGDFAFEADCGANFGFLLLAPIDHPSGTALWQVQALPPSLGPVQTGEYMDERPALTFDFSTPVPAACEDAGAYRWEAKRWEVIVARTHPYETGEGGGRIGDFHVLYPDVRRSPCEP